MPLNKVIKKSPKSARLKILQDTLENMVNGAESCPKALYEDWLASTESSVNRKNGKVVLVKKTRGIQEDAFEFLDHVFGLMDPNALRSLIGFELNFVSHTCRGKKTYTFSNDKLLNFILLKPKFKTVDEGLKRMLAPSLLKDFQCDECGRGNKETFAELSNLSEYFIICIARFGFNTNTSSKWNASVAYDEKISIPMADGNEVDYELVACLFHQGKTLERGHYLASVKHGKGWFFYDDEKVTYRESLPRKNQEIYGLMYKRVPAQAPKTPIPLTPRRSLSPPGMPAPITPASPSDPQLPFDSVNEARIKVTSLKTLNKEYTFNDSLGTGVYGTAYKVTQKATGNPYVIKLVQTTGSDEKISDAVLEYKIQRRALSTGSGKSYVVKVYDVAIGKESVFILMEEMAFSLEAVAKDNDGHSIFSPLWITDTFKGLQHIHEKNIVHRDINPGNILIGKDDQAKLADFGMSCYNSVCGGMKEYRPAGSHWYVAPMLEEFDVWKTLESFAYAVGQFYNNAKKQEHKDLVDQITNEMKKVAAFLPKETKAAHNMKSYKKEGRPPSAVKMIDKFSNTVPKVFELQFPEPNSSKDVNWVASVYKGESVIVPEFYGFDMANKPELLGSVAFGKPTLQGANTLKRLAERQMINNYVIAGFGSLLQRSPKRLSNVLIIRPDLFVEEKGKVYPMWDRWSISKIKTKMQQWMKTFQISEILGDYRVLIPLNMGDMHFFLVEYHPNRNHFIVYDSFNSNRKKALDFLQPHMFKLFGKNADENWTWEKTTVALQRDVYQCGIWTCINMMCRAFGWEVMHSLSSSQSRDVAANGRKFVISTVLKNDLVGIDK